MVERAQTGTALPRAQIAGYVSLCLIWGSTWLTIRMLVRNVPPLEGAALRFGVAAALLLGLAAAQKRHWPKDKQQWKALLVLGLTMMAVPYALIFWAEQSITSSMTAVLYGSSPLVVALLTPLMMQRSVPRRAVFALVVGFGGILVLFYRALENAREVEAGAAVLGAVLLSSWSSVYAKPRLRDIDAVVSTALQLLFGSVFLLWGTWALEPHQSASWSPPALFALAFMTLFGSCFAFVIYYWLLKKMQPYQLATVNLVVPIVAVIEGALLYQERIPFVMVIAMVLVLGSVGAVLRAESLGRSDEGSLLLLGDRPQ